MFEIIKKYLEKVGYTNICLELGREGYYIISQSETGQIIIDLLQLVNEILRNEMKE